jgi:acetyl esterase/lipase
MLSAEPFHSRVARGITRRWPIFLVAMLLAALLYIWPARRNYYGHLKAIDVRLDVAYLAGSRDPKQQLDLYLPTGARGPFPLIVFVHGGYWKPLDRRWLQPLLGTHGNVGGALARRGVAAAIIGYRQYPAVTRGDDSLDDIAHALRFAHENAASWGADPRRIYLMGHSAGGQLVSLIALDPRILNRNAVDPAWVAGFISADGIFDLEASLAYLKPKESKILAELFGTTPSSLLEHSPISFVGREHAPLLFVDSTSDEPICLDGFRAMRSRFTGVEHGAKFVELQGLGHNEIIVRVGMRSDPLTDLVMDFIGANAAQ